MTLSKSVVDRKPRSIRRTRQARKNGEPSEYERHRIDEIRSRATLYKRRLEQLESQLLVRSLLEVELPQVYRAITAIIGNTTMTDREQTDCIRNLTPVDVILDNVARMQAAAVNGADGHGHSADRELGRQVMAA